MAGQDYVPLFLPGHSVTCVASGAITAGQVVSVTAGTLTPGTPPLFTPVVTSGTPNSATVTPTVAATTAATAEQCGVASNTVASGATLAVWFDGWHTLATAGSISAGDPVTAAASGGVADLGTVSSATVAELATVIGHAVSASADGVVIVKLNV
jgi:Uncharacterized conserved protein (DUF2190)